MFALDSFDLDEIAHALQNQDAYDLRFLVDPRTGELVLWTLDGGLDGENPVDLDELDLIPIQPLPPYVWYQDMADFAECVGDEQASLRLSRALRGSGAFRRFKDQLHHDYPELLPLWRAFRDVRARRRAVEWLSDNALTGLDVARQFIAEHPDPDLRQGQ
ncbi:UPF0158 family protein [Amycolatopsis benzoatilytica]|uniref:UPF0158 family protein n=1 Tax=Amycolatopsis benzoatilytica TaxID=346045 RepID=UPI00035EFC84|nr:UPF0158 family protein [Amycolatopsis benzoatilytica]